MSKRVVKSAEWLLSDDVEAWANDGNLAMCLKTGDFFSVGHVEVLHRYIDCSLFKCPSCRNQHDDRMAWNQRDKNVRNGYVEIPSFESIDFYFSLHNRFLVF